MLVLKGLVGLHRTVQLHLLQRYRLGHRLGLLKRREAKSKGEKERYKHLNAEFQRIARRHKKAFFINQCKEIEENNRMGKTRDFFKKIRDTKGISLSHKKESIYISSNEVDEPGAYYSERSKSERKIPIQYINAYIWNLERW